MSFAKEIWYKDVMVVINYINKIVRIGIVGDKTCVLESPDIRFVFGVRGLCFSLSLLC